MTAVLTVKAIVVRQPWATLIALGVKTIETRPFPPTGPMRPEGVRGLPGCSLERGERIAIVAGAQRPKVAATEYGGWWTWGERGVGKQRPYALVAPDGGTTELSFGAVVCTVSVDDALPIVGQENPGIYGGPQDRPCIMLASHRQAARRWWRGGASSSQDITDQLPLGDFTPSRWGWLLSDPRPCEPIPCKGRQGVFELPAEIAEVLS